MKKTDVRHDRAEVVQKEQTILGKEAARELKMTPSGVRSPDHTYQKHEWVVTRAQKTYHCRPACHIVRNTKSWTDRERNDHHQTRREKVKRRQH